MFFSLLGFFKHYAIDITTSRSVEIFFLGSNILVVKLFRKCTESTLKREDVGKNDNVMRNIRTKSVIYVFTKASQNGYVTTITTQIGYIREAGTISQKRCLTRTKRVYFFEF